MTRPTVIAGNWKMHGTRDSARALAHAVARGAEDLVDRKILIFPPFVHLPDVLERTKGGAVGVGAQNVCDQPDGACTGEVSAAMLADLGCSHVLIGHSERRHAYGESDEMIQRKLALLNPPALADAPGDIQTILCVGETWEEREAGRTLDALHRQLEAVREIPEAFPRVMIAYEPVWAIGSGVAATPDLAQEAHAAIRARLEREIGSAARDTVLLYGGSVNTRNAPDLFAMPDIDGGLVGGASLSADEFLGICRAVRK